MKKQPPFKKKRRRIFEFVSDYFKKALISGNLKPGDRLLPERELAAQFKVSRASIREVLRSLEELGIVSVVSRKGTYILPPDIGTLTGLLGLILSLRPAISENILEVRKIIECGAVRIACRCSSPEELTNIKNAISRMHDISNREGMGMVAAQADFDFHKGIIQATHNDFLVFIYAALEVLLKRSHTERWSDALKYIPDAAEVVTKAHESIYEAVVRGNEAMGRELMRAHFQVLDDRKNASSRNFFCRD